MKNNIGILLIIFFFVALQGFASEQSVNLSIPANTIITYFESQNIKDLRNCFYEGKYTGALDKWWLSYEIISENKTKKVDQLTLSGIKITSEAVEIIVEVKMKDKEKNNPLTKFWYLLQVIDGEWKIIEYSHIPDDNYPAYD